MTSVSADDNIDHVPSSWTTILERLDDAAGLIGVDPDIHHKLRVPLRVLEVAVPVRMDDGTVEVFIGWRVQHDTSRGPGKGGLRFHPDLDVEYVHRVARRCCQVDGGKEEIAEIDGVQGDQQKEGNRKSRLNKALSRVPTARRRPFRKSLGKQNREK